MPLLTAKNSTKVDATAGVDATMKTYLGAEHAFLNDARPDVFDAASAAEAWRDIETFLGAELG